MFELLGVNIIAVIVAVILTMVFAAFWYHSKVFGHLWADLHGYDTSCLKGNTLSYIGAFINTFVIAWVLGALFSRFSVETVGDSMFFAFWLWLGFIATTHFSGVIWAKKPFKAYLIDTGFFLIAVEIMAIILAVIRS